MDAKPFLFTVVKRLDRSRGESWREYIQWSGLSHLKEVISIDSCLCPRVITDLSPEDWNHNVHEDCKVFLFRDLPYLLARVPDWHQYNVLALVTEPDGEKLRTSPPPPGFVFKGLDLVDDSLAISVLTNCGGFPDVFAGSELSSVGLIDGLPRANEIRTILRENHPHDSHTEQCIVLAVWRLEP